MISIIETINQIHFSYDRILSMVMKHHAGLNLNAAQVRILKALWQQDGVHLTALAESVGLKKTTVSTMLPRLIEAGYVVRQKDAQDGRAVRICLTDAGRAVQSRHRVKGSDVHERLFDGISEEEQAILARALMRVNDNLTCLEESISERLR